jgi:sugar-phosphatase
VKAAIFDLDGVLIDSEPFWLEAVTAGLDSVGVTLAPGEYVLTQGMRVDKLVDFWHARYSWDGPEPAEVTAFMIGRVVELIRARGRARPGALEALDFFRSRGVPLGLATSSFTPVVRAALESLRIAGSFDVVYSAENEPYGKPHPGVYLTTASLMGVLPQDCVVFEDTIIGALAAKSAQMTCIVTPEPALLEDRRLGIADVVLPSLTAFNEAIWQEVSANGRR